MNDLSSPHDGLDPVEILQQQAARLRVAVVHDWAFTRRGGERVLEEILRLFPQAELFCLFGRPAEVCELGARRRITFSFLAGFPRIERWYKHLLPLLPVAAESLPVQGFDLILSSSHCVAKGIIPRPGAVHVCYVHSPMRYAWDLESTYFPRPPRLSRPLEILRRIILCFLRSWDVSSSARVGHFVANSAFVAKRVEQYYGRTSTVVHPPVDVPRFERIRELRGKRRTVPPVKRVLLFGAWVPYKKMRWALDLLLQARIQVIAAGTGIELKEAAAQHIHAAAEGRVSFIQEPGEEALDEIFAQAQVLLFPAVEDFGIVPVEAMAAGMLVVAPDRGGTAETVKAGVSGIHFREDDALGMLAAVQQALNASPLEGVAAGRLSAHARAFDKDAFRTHYAQAVLAALAQAGVGNGGRN